VIETDISRVILEEYNRRLLEHLENDVVIVGAGPAGLAASYYLAKAGVKTAILEKRLSIGGGIWGGAAGYNVIAVEDNEILDEFGITAKKQKSLYMPKGILYITDAIEFATALAYKAKKAGAEIFNLIEAEDIIVKKDVVEGVVVNNTAIKLGFLHPLQVPRGRNGTPCRIGCDAQREKAGAVPEQDKRWFYGCRVFRSRRRGENL